MSSVNITETQEYIPTVEDIISLFPIIAGGWKPGKTRNRTIRRDAKDFSFNQVCPIAALANEVLGGEEHKIMYGAAGRSLDLGIMEMVAIVKAVDENPYYTGGFDPKLRAKIILLLEADPKDWD